MNELPEITEPEAMLRLLREAPTRRLVAYLDLEHGFYVLCQHEAEAEAWSYREAELAPLAVIPRDSQAAAMLDRAYDYDTDPKGEAPPIRYGPWCSHWVLPEYLAARGQDDDAQDEDDESTGLEPAEDDGPGF
jgi:hypothetical protein